MKRFGLLACSLGLLPLVLLSGCHGGGSANAITIEIIPPASGTSVDVGATQPVNFTATLGDDTTNAGVTWALSGSTCSGSGCGTLSNQNKFSVSYTPPPAPLPSSAALGVTLTATSVAQTGITSTATITVEPLPTFTTTSCIPAGVTAPCGLPGASNGQGYNQPIQISGGVAPYTFSVTTSAPQLTSVCLNLTINQTSSTSTAIAGKPCNGGTSPTPLSFTVQVTDSGGAAPVTQTFAATIAAAPPLAITTPSLPVANLNAAYNGVVAVTGGVTPISWSVSPPPTSSLPPGLSLNSTNGQIAGVPTAAALTGSSCTPAQAGTYCFSVTVTDSALSPPPNSQHQTQTKAYTITVQQPGPLSITTPAGPLAGGTTASGYSASVQATGGVSPLTWSVIQGQLPPGLILNTSNGNIAGVPRVTGNYSFTVQVQDSEIAPATQTKTAQYSISVTAGQDNNSLLQGAYSFIFHGFDKDGSVATIGTLTADGNGNISGAEIINRMSGVAPAATVYGAYTINSTGTNGGASGDGRGTMELVTTIGQQSVTSEYELALQSDGSVQFIQDHDYPTSPTPPVNPDAFATHGAGVMKPVNGSSFAASSFSGNYAFEFTGADATSKKPAALAGFVHANGTGATLTPGTYDFNDAGTYHGPGSLSGDFTFPGSTIGSAEFTLENPQQTLQFEYVFVSNSDLYFIETDASGSANTPTLYRLSGEMILQQPSVSFGSGSLSGTAVATSSGVDASGNAIVTAGLLTSTVCDGNTQNSLAFDQNDNGTVSSSSLAETCAVNPSNGRVAFSWIQPAPPASPVTPPYVAAYLIAPGRGFLIGSDATVTTGTIELQTAAAPFSNSSVSGSYAIGTPLIADAGVNNLAGVVIGDGAGNLSGAVDEADASGASQTLDQPFAATISAVAANGRGTMTTTSPVPTGFPTNWIFYVVSPGQIRAIPADAGSQHPQLIFLGPVGP